MTDLTEKWKKGELIEGKKYYCESKNIVDIFEAECCCKGQNDEWWKLKNEKHCFNNVYHKNDIKVLAPVPSYTEYQALLSDQLAKNEGVEINAELEADCKTLAQTLLKVSPEHREWLETNFKEYL